MSNEEDLIAKCQSYEVVFVETERFWLDTLNSLNEILESVPSSSPDQIPRLLSQATGLITSGYNTIENSREKLEAGADILDLRDEIARLRDGYDADRLKFQADLNENAQYIASLQAELILLRENEKNQPEDWLQKETEWNQKEREGRVLISELQRKVQTLQDAQRSWEQERENGLQLLRKLQGENILLRKESRGFVLIPEDNNDRDDNNHQMNRTDPIDEDESSKLAAEIDELETRRERVSSLVHELQSANRRLSTQLKHITKEEAARNGLIADGGVDSGDTTDEEFEKIVEKYQLHDIESGMSTDDLRESVRRLKIERDRLHERIRVLENRPYADDDDDFKEQRVAPLHSEESQFNLSDGEYSKLKEEMMEQLRVYNQQQLQALVNRQDELRWKERSVQRGDVNDIVDGDGELPDARRPSVDDGGIKEEEDSNGGKSNRHSNLVRKNTLTEWSDMSMLDLKSAMMTELKHLQKEQLESMFKQQDELRWRQDKPDFLEPTSSQSSSLQAPVDGPKISSKSRQSNLVRNRTKTDWQDSDLKALKEEMVQELKRIHVEEMERLIQVQDELRMPRPPRNTYRDDSSAAGELTSDQIAQMRDEMLAQLELITKRELGNMFERQQHLRWAETEQKEEFKPAKQPPPLTPQNTQFMGQNVELPAEFQDIEDEPFEEAVPPDMESERIARQSNLYRSGTQTEWKEADLELLKSEMSGKIHEIQKDQMRKMFEQREALYWVEQHSPQAQTEQETSQSQSHSEPSQQPARPHVSPADPEIQPRMSREGPSQSIVIHDYAYEDDELNAAQDSAAREESPHEINVSSVMWNPNDDGMSGYGDTMMANPNPQSIVPRGSGSLSAAIQAGRDLFGNKFDDGLNSLMVYQASPANTLSQRTDKSQDMPDQFEKRYRDLEVKTKGLELDLRSARNELETRAQELESLKSSKYKLIESTAREIDELRQIIFRQTKQAMSGRKR